MPRYAFYYHNPDDPKYPSPTFPIGKERTIGLVRYPRFRLVGNEKVGGIVTDEDPNQLLIMFDASSGQSWPYQADNETYAARDAKRLALLAAINAQSKQIAYDAEDP